MGISEDEFQAVVGRLESPLEGEREQAVQALVRSHDIRSVPMLQKIASADESVAVRYLARKGLFYLRQQLGLDGMSALADMPDEVVPNKAEALQDKLRAVLAGKDDAQKLKLLQGLAQRKVTQALPVLLAHDAKAEAPEVRSNLVLAAGILGGEDEIPFIRGFLEDEDPRVRANAIEALEYLSSPKVYPLIVRSLTDADNRIRANAIKALRSYGKVNCMAILEKMLRSKKLWMRDSAVYALPTVGGAEAVPLLAEAATDVDESVALKARKGLEVLAERGVAGADEALGRLPAAPTPTPSIEKFLSDFDPQAGAGEDDPDLLTDDDPQKRLKAVNEIAETRDVARKDALLAAAKAEADGFVRARMVIALGRVGDGKMVKHLLPFLDDEVDRVRANAIEAAVMCDRTAAQPFLVPRLSDPNNRVRANAVIALKDYPGLDVYPALEGMLASEQLLMRKSAFYAITDLATDRASKLVARLLDDADPELRNKARGFVEMALADGEPWAKALTKGKAPSPAPAGGFAEFAAPPEPAPAAPAAPGAKVPIAPATAKLAAGDVKERLARFRGQGSEGKKRMIDEARAQVCLESFFFLREAVEDPDFEVKIKARMALKAFEGEDFADSALITPDVAALLKPPEVMATQYKGLKSTTELAKDLNQRLTQAEARGYWEGPWGEAFPILNALREDTREMLEGVLAREKVEKVYLCYQNEKLLPFRQGKKTLDSNRYTNVVSLGSVAPRIPKDTFHGSFMHSQKRPAWMMALELENRLVLFLRGAVETTQASYLSVDWRAIESVEAEKAEGGTTLHVRASGVLFEIPGMASDEAKGLYDRLKEREGSRMGHEAAGKGAGERELKKLDVLRSGGIITEEEYRKRKAALERGKKG